MKLKVMEDVGRQDLFMVPLDRLQEEPGFNLRDENDEFRATVEHYANLLTAGSQPPPLVVREDKESGILFIVDGHRRFRAARLAQERGTAVARLPVTVRNLNNADRVFFVLAAGSGSPLTPIERARGYQRAVALGFSVGEIATKAGRTEQNVRDGLALLEAPTQVLDMVQRGEVSASTAMQTVRAEGDKAVETLRQATAIAKEAGKTRATGRHVRAASNGEASAPKVARGAVNKEAATAAKRLADEVLRQARDAGLDDGTFDDHSFFLPGALLRDLVGARLREITTEDDG